MSSLGQVFGGSPEAYIVVGITLLSLVLFLFLAVQRHPFCGSASIVTLHLDVALLTYPAPARVRGKRVWRLQYTRDLEINWLFSSRLKINEKGLGIKTGVPMICRMFVPWEALSSPRPYRIPVRWLFRKFWLPRRTVELDIRGTKITLLVSPRLWEKEL